MLSDRRDEARSLARHIWHPQKLAVAGSAWPYSSRGEPLGVPLKAGVGKPVFSFEDTTS